MWLRPRNCIVARVSSEANDSTMEADSHADTFCLGADTRKILDHNIPVNVQGYDPALGAREHPTITGALAYVHLCTGQRNHLVIHQAIHMPNLKHHMLCPMQCCVNRVTINDCPRILCDNPADTTHSIVAKDENGDEVILPFSLRGVTSLVSVLPLTNNEFAEHEFTRIELTSKDLTWDPSDHAYEDQENAMTNHRGDILHRPGQRKPLMVITSVTISTS